MSDKISPDSSENAEAIKAFGPGVRLRAAREAKHLSLEQVAEQLRLSKQQINEIEIDDYTPPLALAYAKGRLRLYARFLGLSEHEIIKSFNELGLTQDETLIVPSALMQNKTIVDKSYSPSSIRWWTYGVIILLVMMVVIWWYSHKTEYYKSPTRSAAVEKMNNAAPVSTSSVVNNSGAIPLNLPSNNPNNNSQSNPAQNGNADNSTPTPNTTPSAPPSPSAAPTASPTPSPLPSDHNSNTQSNGPMPRGVDTSQE